MTGKRIAILGAGSAGLAVAYRLLDNNTDVQITIFEREGTVGGLARSFDVAGIPADYGPHRVHTELPEIKTFYQEFLGDDLFEVKRKSQMYFKGGYFDYPLVLSNAIDHLGFKTVMRYGLSAMLASFLSLYPRNRKETFDAVMIKAFGSAAYNDLIRPYTIKTWKTPPEQIDAEVARLRVSAGGVEKLIRQVLGKEKKSDPSALRKFHYLDGGFGSIVKKFIASFKDKPVDIKRGTPVATVAPLPDGKVRIGWFRAGDYVHEIFDFCFSTIPLNDLLRMTTESAKDADVRQKAAQLRFISTILVFIIAKKPTITDNTWLYFPEPNLVFNRGYEGKNFLPGRLQTSKSMICLEVTCFQGDETWKRSDEDIARQVVADFCSTGILDERDVDSTKVVRMTHAYPLLSFGYKDKLSLFWKYLSRFRSIITLGRQGLFQHNNMDHSIYTGFRAADIFMDSSKPAERWYTSEIATFNKFRIID